MRLYMAILGFALAAVGLLSYATSQTMKCYDPLGAATYPQVLCDGGLLRAPSSGPWARHDGAQINVCVAVTNASQRYTFPGALGDYYEIKIVGNSGYLLEGGAAVAATTAVNGHSYPISEGERILWRASRTHIAFIAGATVAGAEICFVHRNPAL